MKPGPKFSFFINIGFLAVSIFGLYFIFSLFEVWAFFPFWIKNLALLGSLLGVYLFARRGVKGPLPREMKPNSFLGVSAVIVLGILGFAVIQAGPALPGRLIQAFTLSLTQPPKDILVSLTVSPPPHTGRPEKTLVSFEDGPVSRKTFPKFGPFPEGSVVTVSIEMEETVTPVVTLGRDWVRAKEKEGDFFITRQVLKEDSAFSVQAGPYVAIGGEFSVVPDKAPKITFRGGPGLTARASLQISADYEDDYGVEEIYFEITAGGSDPTLTKLPYLKGQKTKDSSQFFLNLLDDKRAGERVKGRLIAVDALGQQAASEPLIFDLPEKDFQNPLAREVTDVRKSLLFSPDQIQAQVGRIGVLTADPIGFESQRGAYLALRSVYWRLRSAENQTDIDEVTRFLWQIALTLEDDGSSEENALRGLLEDMTAQALTDPNVRGLELTAVKLRAKADNFFRTEFRQTRRRFTLNAGVEAFEIPQVGQFRELTRVLEREATENHRGNVVKILLEARAVFEDLGSLKGRLPRPRF